MLRNSFWAFGLLIMLTCLALAVAVQAQQGDEPAEEAGDAPSEATPPAEAPPEVGDTDTEVEIEKMSPERVEAYEKDLEKLRERIFKSKSRLMQLYEQLKIGSVSIVGISVLHTHQVGSTFKLEEITYTLDGFEVFHAVNSKEDPLEKMVETPVYEGSLLPGDHLIVVDMVFRGKGYGIFSYLNQYLFKVKSRYSFNVVEGDVLTLKVTSFDEGSFLTPLKNRLRVKFEKD